MRQNRIRDQGVGGSNPLAPIKQSSLASVRYSDGASGCYFGRESSGGSTEGTQLLGRDSFHCCLDRLVFWMHIALRDGNVTVTGKVGERESIHLRRPPRQAGSFQV